MSETAETDWKKAAFELWATLDAIDTLDDACSDDVMFRKLTYERQRRRFEFMSGEEFDRLVPLYRPQWLRHNSPIPTEE